MSAIRGRMYINQRQKRVRLVSPTDKEFYIVDASILPEAIVKTARAKELLARGEAHTVHEAVSKVGLSRSAFYKYRDGIFAFHHGNKEKIVTINLLLEHQAGVLSRLLNTVAAAQANVLTINQNIPLQGVANVSISIEIADMLMGVEELLEKIEELPGVKKVEIVGQT
ncbi:MAG: ACT domain-containing protein [Thermoanaerobacteraceae bacterium]|nr:ACT domain-containing protein [Thermoanaerobacteraceae bacterium]